MGGTVWQNTDLHIPDIQVGLSAGELGIVVWKTSDLQPEEEDIGLAVSPFVGGGHFQLHKVYMWFTRFNETFII